MTGCGPAASTGAPRRYSTCRCPRSSRLRRESTCPGTRRCPAGCGPSARPWSGISRNGGARGCARPACGSRPGRTGGPRSWAPGLMRCLPWSAYLMSWGYCRENPAARRRAAGGVMTVLCLVERDGAGAADASLRAVTFARALAGGAGEGEAAVGFGAVAGPIGETSATAVVAAGTDHGSEVLAHLGAMTGLPVAANCVSAFRDGDGSLRLVRDRWAGSLLEGAGLAASPAPLTLAGGA